MVFWTIYLISCVVGFVLFARVAESLDDDGVDRWFIAIPFVMLLIPVLNIVIACFLSYSAITDTIDREDHWK
jgi:hypothetical protein